MPPRPTADLFGRALLDWVNGRDDPERFERDDGAIFEGAGRDFYLSPYPLWPPPERGALRYVRGRVVDLGCGAGRVALHLQGEGHDVVAVDASRRAITATRRRGVADTRHATFDELADELRLFETIILFGNNFGILGAPAQARRVLRRWARTTSVQTRILAESVNPYAGGAPALDRAYYHRNKARGRLPGQVRMRTHYRGMVGDWEQWLFVSRAEMKALARDTGWRIEHVLGGRTTEEYVAVLEKER